MPERSRSCAESNALANVVAYVMTEEAQLCAVAI